jgi:hypothetical protein
LLEHFDYLIPISALPVRSTATQRCADTHETPARPLLESIVSISNPCGTGSGGSFAQHTIGAGARLTFQAQFELSCKGTYRGEVGYIQNIGQGLNRFVPGPGVAGWLTVGRFTYRLVVR